MHECRLQADPSHNHQRYIKYPSSLVTGREGDRISTLETYQCTVQYEAVLFSPLISRAKGSFVGRQLWM